MRGEARAAQDLWAAAEIPSTRCVPAAPSSNVRGCGGALLRMRWDPGTAGADVGGEGVVGIAATATAAATAAASHRPPLGSQAKCARRADAATTACGAQTAAAASASLSDCEVVVVVVATGCGVAGAERRRGVGCSDSYGSRSR